MPPYVFPAPEQASLPVSGYDAATGSRYAVLRIFCIGRNYAAHAAEMGSVAEKDAPFFFTKSPVNLEQSGGVLLYPQGTADLHHEVELVIALGPKGAVFGYAAGLDMTRRDLQNVAKNKRQPWDAAKDFKGAAIIAAITPAEAAGDILAAAITLDVNGTQRQSGMIADMINGVDELVAHMAGLYALEAGDLIMTGTPSGVGAVGVGDKLVGRVGGLAPVETTIS